MVALRAGPSSIGRTNARSKNMNVMLRRSASTALGTTMMAGTPITLRMTHEDYYGNGRGKDCRRKGFHNGFGSFGKYPAKGFGTCKGFP